MTLWFQIEGAKMQVEYNWQRPSSKFLFAHSDLDQSDHAQTLLR